MLQNNGLLATWAFLLAKDRTEHQKVWDALFDHFSATLPMSENLNVQNIFTELFTSETKMNGHKLRQFTEEALKYSGWLKRGAEVFCDVGEDQ